MKDEQHHDRLPISSHEHGVAANLEEWQTVDHARQADLMGAEPMMAPHYHDTDCSEFLLRIYEYMDGEMGPEESLRFEAHIRECRPCLQQHQVDQKVKGLIRRVAPATVAPEALRASIIARITTIRFESP